QRERRDVRRDGDVAPAARRGLDRDERRRRNGVERQRRAVLVEEVLSTLVGHRHVHRERGRAGRRRRGDGAAEPVVVERRGLRSLRRGGGRSGPAERGGREGDATESLALHGSYLRGRGRTWSRRGSTSRSAFQSPAHAFLTKPSQLPKIPALRPLGAGK